ncbi:hypothetical protein BGX29_009446, partial [Mortierella sp. GBA35]
MSSSSQGTLSPREVLGFANKLLEDATAAGDPTLKTALCSYVDKTFSLLSASVITALLPQTSSEDRNADGSAENRQLILQSRDDSNLHQIPQPWFASAKNHSNLDAKLQELKYLRLRKLVNDIYVSPQAKANFQASNTALFPLMDKMQEFLDSDRQVFLLLGDSGGGKSTFNRHLESYLWDKYQGSGAIPLYISLSAIEEPNTDMIAKQLRRFNFSETQIQELKR